MAETISIYAGSGKAGLIRKRALEKEARRLGRKVSVADLFWKFVKAHGSEKLRRDLEAAELAER
jgi:hypothetical protein